MTKNLDEILAGFDSLLVKCLGGNIDEETLIGELQQLKESFDEQIDNEIVVLAAFQAAVDGAEIGRVDSIQRARKIAYTYAKIMRRISDECIIIINSADQ